MRIISLRKFRDELQTFHEPVEVSRRDPAGNIQLLGVWTPYMQHPPDARSLEPLSDDAGPVPGGTTAIRDGRYVREVKTPEEAAVAAPVGPRAYPKAKQVGRKK